MTLMLMTPLILRLLASIRLRGLYMKKKQEFGPRNLLLQGRKVQQIGHSFSRTIMGGWEAHKLVCIAHVMDPS